MNTVRANSEKWLERLDLKKWADTRVSKFSKGMNERLAFAQALIHDPDFIFLDEPTDGLDPLGRMDVRTICRELAAEGKTVFINSHILAEIEMICDRIALMKSGRLIEEGTIAELTTSRGDYEVTVAAPNGLGDWFAEHNLTYTALDGHYHIRVSDRRAANSLIDALRGKGIEIEAVTAKKRTLETVFLEKVNDV
jgi:ABC-2 type transport system ATP-binding protein